MSISFQIIELPENEQVSSRQVSLPASGGTLGRSFECNIQLPDFGRTLSRVHAEVLPHSSGGFQIIDRSSNGVFVNEIRLGRGESTKLSDGDSIRLGDYVLLVSDMEQLFASKTNPAAESQATDSQNQSDGEPSPFDFDSVVNDGGDSIIGIDKLSDAFAEAAAEPAPTFSKDGVLGEDVYAYDPFEDDGDWTMQQGESGQDDEIVMSMSDTMSDTITEQPQPDSTTGANGSMMLSNAHIENNQVAALDTSISRLNAIVEQQKTGLSASIDRERLFACIEATIDKFLDELSPETLEEEFNDYLSGWGNREKKYWALYKKQFNRKRERREFNRHFSALLLEELRDK